MEDIGPPTGDRPEREDADTLDLCDQCGRAVDQDDLLSALVPDSSVVDATDPELDGERVLLACSPEHLSALIEEYRRRPFVPEEQWAAKVCRTLLGHDEPVPLDLIAEQSGLSVPEAEAGVEWHNERAREWRERYGSPGEE